MSAKWMRALWAFDVLQTRIYPCVSDPDMEQIDLDVTFLREIYESNKRKINPQRALWLAKSALLDKIAQEDLP